jgi:tetratricopeptide (TPR) repeat protein
MFLAESDFSDSTPQLTEVPAKSLFGLPFLIAVTVSVILGGSIITAAIVFSGSRPATAVVPVKGDTVASNDDADKKLDAERKKLDEEKRAVDAKAQKLEVAQLLVKAQSALAKGNHAEAETIYEQAMKFDPSNADVIQGVLTIKAHQLTQAKAKEEEQKRQVETDALVADAQKLIGEKKLREAIGKLESALVLAPKSKPVLDLLTQTRISLDTDQTDQRNVTAFRKHMDAAKVALLAERFAEALREYTSALTLRPEDLEAQNGKRVAENKLDGLKDNDKRKAAFNDFMERARQAMINKRFNDALNAVRPALKIYPDDNEAKRIAADAEVRLKTAKTTNDRLVTAGEEALRLGRMEEAKRLAEEATRNWSEDARAEKLLRQADGGIANMRTAQDAYLRFAQQGALALSMNRFAEAVAAYTEALRLAPLDVEIQRNLRIAQTALEKELRARLEYDRLIRVGNAALQRRSWNEAVRAFGDARKLLLDDPISADGLSRARYGLAMDAGQMAIRSRNRAEAVKAFEAALAERPGDQQARIGLQQAQLMR